MDRNRMRTMGISGALAAAAAVGVLSVAFAGSGLADPAPAATVPAIVEVAAVTPTMPLSRSVADTAPGCGQRAVMAGVFNPSCPEYQGYLDPGTAAGRAPTSGEIQMRALCESGQATGRQCAA